MLTLLTLFTVIRLLLTNIIKGIKKLAVLRRLQLSPHKFFLTFRASFGAGFKVIVTRDWRGLKVVSMDRS